ncbi:hypothetical protein JR338_06385 [Chloroflexota bacterium]|nr:hypothetical protein JR338_06385 [Chloroflexota bacterium]
MFKKQSLSSKKNFAKLLQARDFMGKGNFPEALKIYQPLFKCTESALVASAISSCYILISDFTSAYKWIHKAISIDPREEYITSLAFYHWFEADYENSARLYKEVLSINPHNTFAADQIISIYITPGGEQWVDEDYAKDCLLTISNNSVIDQSYSYYLLGKIAFKHHEYQAARGYLEKAAVFGRPLGERYNKEMIEMMEIISQEGAKAS